MRRLVEKSLLFHETLSKAASLAAGVMLALALGIGAHGAALEAYYTSPLTQFSSYLQGCRPAIEEIYGSEHSNLAEAERDLTFDSGASTSSVRQSIEGKELVRFLSHRPVINSLPGALVCWIFRQ